MLEIEPELDIPFIDIRTVDRRSLPDRAKALWNSLELLREAKRADGEDCNELADFGITITEEDKEQAEALVNQLASGESKDMSAGQAQRGTMLLVGNILTEYAVRVADDAVKVREMIKNKLIIETEHPDAKVRLRALELLGKTGEVGAFIEKKEVTHNHQSSAELRAALRSKLEKLRETAIDAQYTEVSE